MNNNQQVARDIISVNVNMFSGDILLTCTYAQDVNPEVYAELSKGRQVYSFCPELHHLDKVGFKLCTIFRLERVKTLTVLTKDGSPHSMQIPLMVQEAAEDTGFDKANISYYALEGGRCYQISDLSVRKARHYSEIEKLLPFAKLQKVVQILRSDIGCPNDRAENFHTIVDHLREEVEEINHALSIDDKDNLIEEVGDVLFNTALLGSIIEEAEMANLPQIAERCAEKMIKNHPNVFNNLRYKY